MAQFTTTTGPQRFSSSTAPLAYRAERIEAAAPPTMLEAVIEAQGCLDSMIFMAEAAEHHGVAAGDIERARRSLAELQAIRAKLEDE